MLVSETSTCIARIFLIECMYLSGIPSQSLGLPLSQEELKFIFTLNFTQERCRKNENQHSSK